MVNTNASINLDGENQNLPIFALTSVLIEDNLNFKVENFRKVSAYDDDLDAIY